jgi:AraC-like DNA-binding protein
MLNLKNSYKEIVSMKLEDIRILREPDKSFIVYHETNPFAPWHHHPEYELTLVTRGKGKRMIGDHIDRFEENDLILTGPFLPHQWLCDREYYDDPPGFQGEGIGYQFLYSFVGDQFFEIPENRNLKRILHESTQGVKFSGQTRERIISLMGNISQYDNTDLFYSLISIFSILAKTNEYTLLSSPGFMEPYYKEGNEPLQKALEYIIRNFHKRVSIKEMLEITNMSGTAFCLAFKKLYQMTFKEYLLHIRIGYACRLLAEGGNNISQIAYNCGFENISNFNRQFKKLRGITPSKYQDRVESGNLEPARIL